MGAGLRMVLVREVAECLHPLHGRGTGQGRDTGVLSLNPRGTAGPQHPSFPGAAGVHEPADG